MRRWKSLVVGLVLGACGDNGGDPHDHVVRVDAEPQGANCAYGGTAIHTGIDTNRNDALDDDEIVDSEFICNGATSVKCIQGENNVTGPVSVSEASAFAALADVDCIDGDFIVLGSSLSTLPELPRLKTVTGSVIIAANAELESLDGLPSIRDVGQKYVVQGNRSLTDLSAIGGLKRFENIAISGNDSLVDLAGLETFTEIDGGLQIYNNVSLETLHGLENLTMNSRERILVHSNRSLTSVAALSKLRSTVLLQISSNASLLTIDLPELQSVDVYVLIEDNSAVTSVQLPALVTSGGLYVRSNPVLGSVNAPELLLSGTSVFENDLLLASINVPKLTYNTSEFTLVNLPKLTALDASSLLAVGGRLHLYGLPLLATMNGFASLESTGGDFYLRGCNSLTDFTGFSNLVSVSNMSILENTELTNFNGLDAMAKVNGNLLISNNPKIPQLTAQAFAADVTVSGTVTIN